MIKYQMRKMEVGRFLSIGIPILAAVVLSFGNDILSWHYMEENDLVEVATVKNAMFMSNVYLILGLLLTILLSNFIFRQIIRQELVEPLSKLKEGIDHVRKGDLEYRIPYDEEESLYEVYENFNEMIVETRRLSVKAKAVDEDRKKFLLSVAHDLRSPLTSIVAYVQGLIDGIDKNEEMRSRYLQTIKTKALDIDRMVDRLFVFAKLDSGKYEMHEKVFDVGESVTQLFDELKPQYESNRCKLTLQIKSSGKIKADEDLFRRVCLNIIENSMKYNDKEHQTLKIEVKEEMENVRIRFIDNGPGVRKEELPRLFDIMYRADNARSNPSKGSGIGLAIVKEAVGNMNGSVFARNGNGVGFVVVIRIQKVK